MFQLFVFITLHVTYEQARQRMYYGTSRDTRDTYTKARHVRVLEQRGYIRFTK